MENGPVYRESVDKMSEQFGKVSDFAHLQLEYTVVVVNKRFYEQFFVKVIDKTESLSQQAKKVLIDSLHHATLNDHIN